MRLKTLSFDSVMIYYEDTISEMVLDNVRESYKALKSLDHIIELTPSYNSMLLRYDINHYDYKSIKKAIVNHLKSNSKEIEKSINKIIEIPVDYSKGIDLPRVASINNLTIEEVIKRHKNVLYRVYAIGFLEGFAYLAKVDDSITTPRLDSPRDKVAKGSVAIADNQTAIYPQDSAGGWNIIGHTDFEDFDQFEIGDSVRFISV